MENEKTGNQEKIRISRADIFRKILIFAALLAVTAALLRPLQITLSERMEKIRDTFISRSEDYLGLKIQYGSIGPSLFGVLDIRNLLILREDGSVLLSVSRLRLSYSLFSLLRGNARGIFHSVRIDRPVLSLDLEKDPDLAERFAALRAAPREDSIESPISLGRDFLSEKFSCNIWDGEWALSGTGGNLKLKGVSLNADLRGSQVSFQGRWDAEGSAGGGANPFKAAMSGRINGDYSENTREGRATVLVPSLDGSFLKFEPMTFSIILSRDVLEVRKIHDRSPLAMSLIYDLKNSWIKGRLEGENFSPGNLFSFQGKWKDYNPWLAFAISGSAEFEKKSSGDFDYRIDFSGTLPENLLYKNTSMEASWHEPASLNMKISGNNNHLMAEVFDFRLFDGELSYRGGVDFSPGNPVPAAPYGSLSLSDFRLHGNSGLSGIFFISTTGSGINLFADNLTAGNASLSAVDASFYFEEKGFAFSLSALSFRNMGSYENVRMSNFSLEGYLDNALDRHLEASLRLDSFSIGALLYFIEPIVYIPSYPAFARSGLDDLWVTTEIFFTTDFEHLLYNAPRLVAAYEGYSDVLAAASLSGTNMRFDLSSGRISWEQGNAGITCSVDFSDPDDISFSMSTVYRDFAYFFEGMILDRKNVSVRGSYGFQVYLSADDSGFYSGYAQGDNIPVPSGKQFASVSFLVSLNYASASSWRAAINKFEISGLNTPASTNAFLRMHGEASEAGLNIPVLFFDDGKGVLSGEVSASWDTTYSFCRFRIDVSGSSRNEFFGLQGSYRDKVLELYLSGRGMQLSRVSAHNAVMDGSLRLTWESLESFHADAQLSSLVLSSQNGEVKASATANFDNSKLAVNQLKINFSGLEANLPFFRIDRNEDRAETEASIKGKLAGSPIDISFSGAARFGSTNTWLDLLTGFNSIDGSLNVLTARFDVTEASEPFIFSFSGNRGRDGLSLNLNGGPKNMLRFRYNSGGAVDDNNITGDAIQGGKSPDAEGGYFYAALSSPSPVRGSIAGSISSSYIDARINDLYVDLGSLWKLIAPIVGDSGVKFPGGIVTASVRIAGSIRDPEFFGTAKGTSVQILVPNFIPVPICPVPTTFLLTGTEMTFGPVDAVVGQGQGIASAWFRFENWVPGTFNIDIMVPEETPIPYSFDLNGVIAHGLVSGTLLLGLEDLLLTVTGDLNAHNTEVSVNANEMAAAELLQNTPVDEFITTVTDIYIKSGRRVEFFWPSADFPMLQANADMGTGIHVTTDSSSRRFTFTGDLKLRSGELFYLERNFYLREGTIIFREDETEFNPYITARAEIRDRTENGPVTVSLIIDNAPLMSFTPRFESNPALSQIEIYSLLGQNPQGDVDQGQQRNLATSALIDTLAQFMVVRGVQREVRDFLGLDMFSVRTQVFQNMVLQAAGTRPQANSLTSTYRVGNYFDNSTVYIGKYFAADLFGQAIMSFKYDENKLTWGGLTLEPEISLEMRNPLFDIRFNMVPLHPEYWFMNDISFSVIWRRTF